jgi:23S rRNA (uracil1939-C5)-methyltransferase
LSERLTIDHLGQHGDGVAIAGSKTVYVPGTLPGEIVEVAELAGHPDRRLLLSIVTASPERIAPFCPVFTRCGGCAIQHWEDAAYRRWKRNLVVTALQQARIETTVSDLVDAHGAGRRRAVFHARKARGGEFMVGFAAAGSHDIIPIDHCPVLDPALSGALDVARAIADILGSVGKPLDIQVTATDNGLDVDVRGSGAISPQLTSVLAKTAHRLRLARLTRHGELVVQIVPPTLHIGSAQVTLPPGSFLQPTVRGEEILADRVMALCDGAKSVADLFCGVGPFALRLAARARVAAFDSDEGAIASLQKAVATTQGLKPLKAEQRDLFRRPLMPSELDFQAVVFDPPRQGAQAQAQQLAQSRVRKVVAVSCDAATFARDARILIEGGYRLESVTPVDQFRHTAHVEIIGAFSR